LQVPKNDTKFLSLLLLRSYVYFFTSVFVGGDAKILFLPSAGYLSFALAKK